MRFIFGIVVGIALVLGIAFFHDNNLPPVPRTITDRAMVNWDVLDAVVRGWTDAIGRAWDGLTGR
jgi:hypothetical protein